MWMSFNILFLPQPCSLYIRYSMLTYDIVRRELHVRHRIRYRHTMSYVVHVRCRMFSLTYDVVYDVYTRCRTSNIRCRTCTYDVDRTYNILRTMSQIHNLNIVRAMSYVRCDIRCRTSDLRCHVGRRTTSYVTYDIVGGKNPLRLADVSSANRVTIMSLLYAIMSVT